jgi:hypothetical protein
MALPSRRSSTEKSSLPRLNPCHAQKLKSLKQCQEGIMKLSLLGTAGCLDRAAGGPWPLVGTALFQPIGFVRRFINENAYALPIAVGSVISLFLIADPAAADPYKWCAVERNGGTNCGFTTIEQCRATVSGIGGFCQPNSFYTGSDKTSAQRSPKQAQRKPPAEHRAQEQRAQEHRAQERRATETPAPERRGPEDRFQ